jgi:hypothetical protein
MIIPTSIVIKSDYGDKEINDVNLTNYSKTVCNINDSLAHTILFFHENFEFVNEIKSIPNMVLHLILNDNFDMSIDNIGNNVEILVLKKNFNQKINKFSNNLNCLKMPFLKINNYILDIPHHVKILTIEQSNDLNNDCVYSKIKINSNDIMIYIPEFFKNKLCEIIIDHDIYIKNIVLCHKTPTILIDIKCHDNSVHCELLNNTLMFTTHEKELLLKTNNIYTEDKSTTLNILLFDKNKLKKIKIATGHLKKNFTSHLFTLNNLSISYSSKYLSHNNIASCVFVNTSYLPSIIKFLLDKCELNNLINMQNTIKILCLNKLKKGVKIKIPLHLVNYSSDSNNIIKKFCANTRQISIILSKVVKNIKFPPKINKLVIFDKSESNINDRLNARQIFNNIFKHCEIDLLIINSLGLLHNINTKNIKSIITKEDDFFNDNSDYKKISILNF